MKMMKLKTLFIMSIGVIAVIASLGGRFRGI